MNPKTSMTMKPIITIGLNWPCYKRRWGIRIYKPFREHGLSIHIGRYIVAALGKPGPGLDYACPHSFMFGLIRLTTLKDDFSAMTKVHP